MPVTPDPELADRLALDALAILVALPQWQINGSVADWAEHAAGILTYCRQDTIALFEDAAGNPRLDDPESYLLAYFDKIRSQMIAACPDTD